MVDRNMIKEGFNIISLSDFEIKLTKGQKVIRDKILREYLKEDMNFRKIKDIIDNKSLEKEYIKIYNLLIEEGLLIKLPEDIVLHRDVLTSLSSKIIEFLKENESITLGEAKELLGLSRKYLVGILEYLDKEGVTKRVQDKRLLK